MAKDPAETIVALFKYDRNGVWHKRIKSSLRREWRPMYDAIKRLVKQQEKLKNAKATHSDD